MKLRCDVAVVGSGFAGLAAALEALRLGASVIILGGSKPFAGNSAIGSGGFLLVDTPLQKAQGIADSAELLAHDILDANRHSVPNDIVEAAAHEALTLYDWLTSMGARFVTVRPLAGHSVPRVHRNATGGSHVLKLLLEKVRQEGSMFMPGTIGNHLMIGARGIEGIQAFNKEGVVQIEAVRGVVLAAGGFGQNREMVRSFLPGFSALSSASGPGTTGDGIRMGIECGAKSHDMNAAVLASLGSVKTGRPLPGMVEAMLQGGILVNKNGERFVDERKGLFSDTAYPMTLQPESIALLVFDEAIKKRIAKLERHADTYIRKGSVFFGKHADELASKAGVERESFSTVAAERYPSGNLYGTWVKPTLAMTHGGLLVDRSMRVIHRNDYPISRLFAAGDNTAGLGGNVDEERPFPGYIGTGYLWALASGRIAGRNAATG
jgi:fumarate reductase flavoprotein subunit